MKTQILAAAAALCFTAGFASAQTAVFGSGSFSSSMSESALTTTGESGSGGFGSHGSLAGNNVSQTQTSTGSALSGAGFGLTGSLSGTTTNTNASGSTTQTGGTACTGFCNAGQGSTFSGFNGSASSGNSFGGLGFTTP